MIWSEDDFELKEKRPVGRPVVDLFIYPELEEDFVLRGRAMLDLYYRPEPGKKKDFVFDPRHAMSKTHFWSIIFIYLKHRKMIRNNLQGFLSLVQKHFGTSAASDRTSISKNVSMQRRLFVGLGEEINLKKEADNKAREKYQSMYLFVIRRWLAVAGNTEDDDKKEPRNEQKIGI